MKNSISSEIIIHASKEKVWNILTDFDNYHSWNPFIINSSGLAIAGAKLVNTMKNKEKQITFKTIVISVEPFQYFDWLGSLIIKGIFDGHHYFKLEELGNGKTKLTQGENFSGLLSGLILKSIGAETKNNFEKMNSALKKVAEQSEN